MARDQETDDGRLKTSAALRHVLIFQVKLAADALRDFLLSPISLIAFAIDAVTNPPRENSLYLRLMHYGRRSDRMINLFDDYDDDYIDDYENGELSIDRAIDKVEDILRTAHSTEQRKTNPQDDPKADESA